MKRFPLPSSESTSRKRPASHPEAETRPTVTEPPKTDALTQEAMTDPRAYFEAHAKYEYRNGKEPYCISFRGHSFTSCDTHDLAGKFYRAVERYKRTLPTVDTLTENSRRAGMIRGQKLRAGQIDRSNLGREPTGGYCPKCGTFCAKRRDADAHCRKPGTPRKRKE